MRKYFLLFATLFVAINLSAYDFRWEGYYFKITSESTLELTSGEEKYAGDIVIPKYVPKSINDYYIVTGIDNYAFEYCSELTSITVEENIE